MNFKKVAITFCLALLSLYSLSLPVHAAAASNASDTTKALIVDQQAAEQFLDAFFSRADVSEMGGAHVVSVVHNGQVVAERGYGIANSETVVTPDPSDTTFRVGSVSKLFTVMALLQLVDQEKVKLQDNIEDYLGGYKLDNPFHNSVTVEMLLTHTTGFEVRDPTSDNVLFDQSQKPVSLKESVFATFPPVVREPGSSYMYDNFASQLVGYIVETVSGEPFHDYVHNHLFEPLGMKLSSFNQNTDAFNKLSKAYGPDGSPIPDYRLSPDPLPEGGMVTTAEDMGLFMHAMMNGAKGTDGKPLLSKASLDAMFTYTQYIHADVPDMAYGFEAPPLHYTNGHHVIAKGGSIPGFESYLFMLPNEKTGVFISSSTETNLPLLFYETFMAAFYPGESKLGDPAYKGQSAAELKRFEGIYSDLRIPGMLTNIQVKGDGELTYSDQAGQKITLFQRDELLFVDEIGAPAAFKTDAKGNVLYIKYSNPGSYAAKLPKGQGFKDVAADHAYAPYIYGLQSLGIIGGGPADTFGLEEVVSREQFVVQIMHQFNIPPSEQQPVFKDIRKSE